MLLNKTPNYIICKNSNIRILEYYIMNIIDLYGNRVDIEHLEVQEQSLANQYILENDVVLELGARYGSVSCIINSKLNNKNNQVVVEPDGRVWNALEQNKNSNNCGFNIVKGFISNKKLDLTNLDNYYGGYGATFIESNDTKIPSYSLDEITNKYNLKFNVLVADCEGFLEVFFDENPLFYDNLRLIIFEADYSEKCNYNKIKNKLLEKKFTNILNGHQNVWIKTAF
jgi:FkbM family methyltransferase